MIGSMQSCLYRGYVRHRRTSPDHRFRYASSWAFLDLGEVDAILRRSWLLSGRRFAPACYRRSDHFGKAESPLSETVRGFVQEQTGIMVSGPIRLLTQLRHFGLYFSPVNLFYCFDDADSLQAVVAEVSNTPWNQRHCYVLWEGNRIAGSKTRYAHPKTFHVSPFMGMDSEYQWRVGNPGESLNLSIGCVRGGSRIFHADLHLKRTPLTDGQLMRSLLRHPVAAAQILGAIYYQALRLWMKKCQFYPHPRTLPARGLVSPMGESTQVKPESLARR